MPEFEAKRLTIYLSDNYQNGEFCEMQPQNDDIHSIVDHNFFSFKIDVSLDSCQISA